MKMENDCECLEFLFSVFLLESLKKGQTKETLRIFFDGILAELTEEDFKMARELGNTP